MVLEIIIWASFILAVGLFGAIIGFYVNFFDKIKEYLKNEENTVLEDVSKATAEEMVKLIKDIPPPDQLQVAQITDSYKKVLEKQLEIVKRRELIREPFIWLNDLKRGICLAILLLLASGTLGLSYYNTYAPPIFVLGVGCIVYGVYKFYQITNRVTP